jgi:hypothetical protein
MNSSLGMVSADGDPKIHSLMMKQKQVVSFVGSQPLLTNLNESYYHLQDPLHVDLKLFNVLKDKGKALVFPKGCFRAWVLRSIATGNFNVHMLDIDTMNYKGAQRVISKPIEDILLEPGRSISHFIGGVLIRVCRCVNAFVFTSFQLALNAFLQV